MSEERKPAVDHGTLVLGERLGTGGQGTVYEVPGRRINKHAPDGGWDVVYKEYAAAVLPDLDADALAAQVGLLRELSGADARWLCGNAAWPAAVVERDGRARGFLMRAVPDRFRFAYRGMAGAAAGGSRLANLEYLLNDDGYVARIGLTISERDRLLLLADLAATLDRLHRIGITVGDLSPKNLLFTTDPRPECFLIDCDAMRLRGASVLPQAETPDWQVPAGEEKATRTSDVHKLALLAVRLFARHQTARDPAVLTAVSPALAELARAGLDPDPARRPSPGAWAEQLTATAATASATPATAPASGAATPSRPPAPAAQPQAVPAPGTVRPPGAVSGGNATVQRWLVAIAACVALVVLIAVAAAHSGSHSTTDTARTTATTSDDSSYGDDGSYDDSDAYDSGDSSDSGGADPTDTVPPLSAEDEEFGAVTADDCLSNYNDEDLDWTPSTPETTDCSDPGAYYVVTSVPSDDCGDDDDMTWYHSNDDDTDTDLCLNRNYVTGQCMYAEKKGDSLSIYFNAATPCDAGIPDDYQYIVRLTDVYDGAVPGGACTGFYIWHADDGTSMCGRAIYKGHGLPDM
ncbi:LppU/SCO3897 family protein [Actinacidiphila sp. bgisy145]|uniref:LppU/SCO3897 family protein n=1 Tax=Actinacidiphila sp. bgisy145 TaxID=3413792 RepID=UPI003EB97400